MDRAPRPPRKEPAVVEIASRDFWVKVVGMLEQNWALVDDAENGGGLVLFVSDRSEVFDRLSCLSRQAAEDGLRLNGFRRFAGDARLREFLAPPGPPFREGLHPNGPIYSSGRLWDGSGPPSARPAPGRRYDGEDVAILALSGRLRVACDPEGMPELECGRVEWDRIEGMLLGLAIGDALGNTTEGLTPARRRAQHGEIRDYLPNRHAGLRPVGLPSDDTQLAFWTLEHLLEGGRLDPVRLGERFASRQVFGAGSTFRAFLAARRPGQHWLDASQESAGNGALMRIAPVLVPHLSSPGPALGRDVAAAGAVTHNDFASGASCGAFAALLGAALAARPPVPAGFWLHPFLEVASCLEGTVRRYSPRAPGLGTEKRTLVDHAREVVRNALAAGSSALEACESWYSGAYLLETVPSVLFLLERHGNDPEEAIARAVNDTLDSDTIAALVGAAVGALHGAARLPERWRQGLSGRTGEDDDGRVQALIREARARWYSAGQAGG
jgi:ADP-ribosyl-[dinitrogen reductase] hydrolase